ncbi:MAG: hypothetical protein WA063_02105 [Minisyncoccia bacterium]
MYSEDEEEISGFEMYISGKLGKMTRRDFLASALKVASVVAIGTSAYKIIDDLWKEYQNDNMAKKLNGKKIEIKYTEHPLK